MNANLYFFAGIISFFFSCTHHRENTDHCCTPTVVEARGYSPPRNYLVRPDTIAVGKPQITSTGKPYSTPSHPNQRFVIDSGQVQISSPTARIPGHGAFIKPSIQKSNPQPVIAGTPEIYFAQNNIQKESLPQNINSFGKLQGLQDEIILVVYEDHLHRQWFGTRGGGVILYDGRTFFRFTEKQGLGNNEVYSITEDRHGRMWFGTRDGVTRYGKLNSNGRENYFIHFSKKQGFTNSTIKSIFEDRKGNLWFAPEDGGIIQYSYQEDFEMSPGKEHNSSFSWNEANTFSYFKTAQGFSDAIVNAIQEDMDGNLWFASGGDGLFVYKDIDSRPKNKNHRDSIQRNALSESTNKAFFRYSEEQGLDNNFINALFEDNRGRIWFSTYAGLVFKLEGESFFRYGGKNALSNHNVNSISEDRYGAIWMGTDGDGLIKYLPSGKFSNTSQLTQFKDHDGLSSNNVKLYFKDKNGSIWFGYDKGGVGWYDNRFELLHLDALNYKLPKEKEGNLFITCILHDGQGRHWFGTDGAGLIKYDGTSFHQYTQTQGLSSNYITSLIEDRKGNIWIGTGSDGIVKFNGSMWTKYTTQQGLSSNEILSMVQDLNGNIWIGTARNGLMKYDGESILKNLSTAALNKEPRFINFTTKQGLSSNEILCLKEDKQGNLWIGTRNGGVNMFDSHVNPDGKASFVRFTDQQGLQGKDVVNLAESRDGYLWFSNWGGGVSRYDPRVPEGPIKNFTVFTSKEGLANNFVHSMMTDSKDHLWLGTNAGLCRFVNDFKQKIEPPDRYLDMFSSPPGDPILLNCTYENKFWEAGSNSNLIDVDKKDFIWIASKERIAVIRPTDETQDGQQPEIRLNGLTMFNEKINWTDFQHKTDTSFILRNGVEIHDFYFDQLSPWFMVPQSLSLASNNNFLTFHYSGITPGSNEELKYQFRLMGFDKNWSAWTSNDEVSFVNLPPAHYSFKLKAMNSDGILSKEFNYDFIIRPPWWATWWARGTYAVLALGGMLSLIFLRTRRLTAQKKILESKVVERTLQLHERTEQLQSEKQKSDDLLLNILPTWIAEELKNKGRVEAKEIDDVTILFGDFKDFTQIAQNMSHQELVEEIHQCYQQFDAVITKYGLEKIKTIGDSYMAAGGLPVPQRHSVKNTILAALDMQAFISHRKKERTAKRLPAFEMRVGIHTGTVVAGVVGAIKFQYDIWGDTVNTASRLENTGEVDLVNISYDTYKLIKYDSQFEFISRGSIEVKGKGRLPMYYVFHAGSKLFQQVDRNIRYVN